MLLKKVAYSAKEAFTSITSIGAVQSFARKFSLRYFTFLLVCAWPEEFSWSQKPREFLCRSYDQNTNNTLLPRHGQFQ